MDLIIISVIKKFSTSLTNRIASFLYLNNLKHEKVGIIVSEKKEHASSSENSSDGSKYHSHEKKKMHWFWKLVIILAIIILVVGLIGAGVLFYIYKNEPAAWTDLNKWADKKLHPQLVVTENIDDLEVPESAKIPEAYYEGHRSTGGEISRENSLLKLKERLSIDDTDMVMVWPDMIKAGQWIWESDQAFGPVGKLASDGWLFWADKQYGSMYPHTTYYVVVYSDGFADVFTGSYTPMTGEDDWLRAGTKAITIQEGKVAEIEGLQIE